MSKVKPTLTRQQFVSKWSQIRLTEISSSQSHFNDVCALVGHKTPTQADPDGQFFTFEAPTEKAGGRWGRADVWYSGKFIWEYKGPHADLDKAYQQLLLYREYLGNPPLLITSDTRTIILHTNFTDTIKEVHEITLERILHKDGLDLLQRAFHDPMSFEPERTQEQVTRATADAFVAVTDTLKKWERDEDPERLAHFIIRLLFCLFAEDLELLPEEVFTKLVTYRDRHQRDFASSLRALFDAMRSGGVFGFYPIPEFDGTLFDDDYVPDLPSDIMDDLARACKQDWSGIDPSIFGTLFERAIDESKRAQLGAHYTSKEDIMLIVEPVLMKPLRERWQAVKNQARGLVQKERQAEAHALLQEFSHEIASTRVLDPACGSGNFLYVALRQLLDLQKEVIAFAGRHELDDIPLTVGPDQLYGIEINPYAHELAQVTVWIGYLQWRSENGFADFAEPILRPLRNIERKDAILAHDAAGDAVESEWPSSDVIIGNPPFLGSHKLRSELGDTNVESLFALYRGRVPGAADLVCYWFERARGMIETGSAQRAGLLATQGIRGGANRAVLERIKDTGDIFWAQSDRDWILDGAAVRISMVGFDDGSEHFRSLDGTDVATINPDLTAGVDLSRALRLAENAGICFRSDEKGGPFDIQRGLAERMLAPPSNPSGRPNSDVVRPYVNARDITQGSRGMWIIDFGCDVSASEAALYQLPFEHVRRVVKPVREKVRNQRERRYWWLHRRPAPDMREAVAKLPRFLVTPRVAKHRLFVWLDSDTIPDCSTYAFARHDDYFFGVLHSRPHELWALRQGTHLEDRPRYTPTSTFETFPLPWPPGQEPAEDQDDRVSAIAQAARYLVALRQAWLHPPSEEIGVTISERMLKRRTLTNLYNALVNYRDNVKGRQRNPRQWDKDVSGIITLDKIEELDHIHCELDRAVLDAYGWPHTLTDDQILERLLALNLERAAQQESEE